MRDKNWPLIVAPYPIDWGQSIYGSTSTKSALSTASIASRTRSFLNILFSEIILIKQIYKDKVLLNKFCTSSKFELPWLLQAIRLLRFRKNVTSLEGISKDAEDENRISKKSAEDPLISRIATLDTRWRKGQNSSGPHACIVRMYVNIVNLFINQLSSRDAFY